MTFVQPDPDPTYEPLFVAANAQYNNTDDTKTTVSTPGAAGGTDGVGDFLLFVAGTGTSPSNASWTVPSGFTSLVPGGEQGNMTARMFYRLATGSEAASYVSNMGYTYRRLGAICRYRRVNGSSLIRGQNTVVTATGASGTVCPTPGDLSSQIAADDLVIRVFLASETDASSSNTQSITNTALTNAGW